MASSNRHWPSMFKSKPCNPHHQWQHDINPSSLLSTACQKPPYSSSGIGGEERSPEPKPRWNPKPEQIRILEAIFNSGMVNPPRDEIRRIRVQLQEYGQVGDANVFYWFQNRKSRSKHKQRQLQSRQNQTKSTSTALASSTSSSSGSDKTATGIRTFQPSKTTLSPNKPPSNTSNSSPTTSVNQTTLFPSPQDLPGEPMVFPGGLGATETDPCVGLWTEMINQGRSKEFVQTPSNTKGKMELHPVYGVPTTTTTATSDVATNTTINSSTKGSNNNTLGAPFTDILQGVGGVPARMVVFINDVAFEVGMGPLNVREAFGGEAVLLHSTGLPVLVDEWGVTIQPLQHGGSYYLI